MKLVKISNNQLYLVAELTKKGSFKTLINGKQATLTLAQINGQLVELKRGFCEIPTNRKGTR
jgi:hypothetical protein